MGHDQPDEVVTGLEIVVLIVEEIVKLLHLIL
jgi:hypothetical protein